MYARNHWKILEIFDEFLVKEFYRLASSISGGIP
jgi:hypothetical protein